MRRRLLLSTVLLLLGSVVAGAEEVWPDDTPPSRSAVAPSRSALDWSGGAVLTGIRPMGPSDLLLHLSVANPADEVLSAHDANLFAVGLGGWLTPIEEVLRARMDIGPRSDKFIGENMAYSVATSASHLLVSAAASDGHSEFVMPLLKQDAQPPAPYEASYPLGVGVAGPLEVLPLADGRSSLVLLGQVQCLSGVKPENVKVEALLADSTGAFDPKTWQGLGAQEDAKRIWPFVRRLDVPETFRGGVLRVTVSATLDRDPVTYVKEWPVEAASPVVVQGPVLGTWHLVNGPGQTGLHANYRNPCWRYSYDFIVVEQGTTYRGPPHKKESYFAWGRTVRAVAAGKVIDACDREVDNAGLGLAAGPRGDCQGVNRVVIEHDDGVRTVYFHLRQFSKGEDVRPGKRVEAGQVIADVGNSGDSMEPHLHLVAYRLDATGRPRPVALTFSNAYEDLGRQQPLKGVPVGGRTLHFVDR